MLKRPSTRRRSHSSEVQINLVPMLDALVTMISFLMYTMAFLSLTMIESPLPIISPDQDLHKLKERPLQLTLTINEKDVLLWSPFELIPQQTIPNRPMGTTAGGGSAKPTGAGASAPADDGGVDTLKLHEALISIKQKFPTENKIILVPKKDTSYDTIVAVLDASKALDKTDPVIVVKNEKTGVQEQAKQLFGEVVFGNLLGSDE